MKQFEIQNVKDTRSGFGAGLSELGKGLVSSPIKWMVVGLILIVVGAILGLLVGAGGFIGWIGSLIFLIGLLFWLLEMI